jgi:hypothetical protein
MTLPPESSAEVSIPHCGMLTGEWMMALRSRSCNCQNSRPTPRNCSASMGLRQLPLTLLTIPMRAPLFRGRVESGNCDGQRRAKEKRGGARIIYVYLVFVGRIYLIRCYAKTVKTDLTAEEKKELRRSAAYLRGAQ